MSACPECFDQTPSPGLCADCIEFAAMAPVPAIIEEINEAVSRPGTKMTVRIEAPPIVTVAKIEPVASSSQAEVVAALDDVATEDDISSTEAVNPFREWLAEHAERWPRAAAMLAEVSPELDAATLLVALSKLGRHDDVLALGDARSAFDNSVAPGGLFATCKSCGVRGTGNLPSIGQWGPLCDTCRATMADGCPTGPLAVARFALRDASLDMALAVLEGASAVAMT